MFSFFAIAFGLCLLMMAKGVGHFNIYVVIVICLFSAAYLIDIKTIKRCRKFFFPLLIGYLLRIALLFYDVFSNDPLNLPLVGGALSSDPLRFFNTAISYSQGLSTSYGGTFPKLLGIVFSCTEASRLWAEFIVLLFSLATIHVFVRILDELRLPETVSVKAVYLICLLPHYAFLSVVLRRETLITFFLAMSVLYFIRWFRNRSGIKSMILAIVFALGASVFHGASGIIIAGYIFIMILYSPKKKTYTLDTVNLISAIIFMAILLFVYSRFGATFFEKIERRLGTGALSSTRDAGGSSYARYVGDAKTPIRILIYAFPRFAYFMYSPFPWQWRGFSDVISFLMSSLVYLSILIRSLVYIRKNKTEKENRSLLIALLLIAIIGAAVFSWGVTNTGTATRHRDKFIVLYILIFALSSKSQPGYIDKQAAKCGGASYQLAES